MKELALLVLLLLLSACLQQPASPEGSSGGLGIDEAPALDELPDGTGDSGLSGQQVDIGSPI